jgi:hypothetical protein
MYFNINGIDRIPNSHRMLPSLFNPNPFVCAVGEICHREDEKVSMVLFVSVWKIPLNTQTNYLTANRHRKFCEYKHLFF